MKQAMQFVLRAYKRWVSPMLPHSCRFVPTCSEYAMEAIEMHGALRGTLLATGRLLRCHPFARAGYDPPPRPVQERDLPRRHEPALPSTAPLSAAGVNPSIH